MGSRSTGEDRVPRENGDNVMSNYNDDLSDFEMNFSRFTQGNATMTQ